MNAGLLLIVTLALSPKIATNNSRPVYEQELAACTQTTSHQTSRNHLAIRKRDIDELFQPQWAVVDEYGNVYQSPLRGVAIPRRQYSGNRKVMHSNHPAGLDLPY